MKRFITIFICLLLVSYAFAGGGGPSVPAQPTLEVYTGDYVNLKQEFWLSAKDTLVVEKIAETQNGNLELTLYDDDFHTHYVLIFTPSDYKEPVLIVGKKCGLFDGLYRIKSWKNNRLTLTLDKSLRWPDSFWPLPSEINKYSSVE